MKKKACKKCKMLYTAEECPACKSAQFVLNWKGRIAVIDPKVSDVAKKIGANDSAEYAIKVA